MTPVYTLRRAIPADAPGILAVLDTVAAEAWMPLQPGGVPLTQIAQTLAADPQRVATWVVTDPETGSIGGTSEAIWDLHPYMQGVVTLSLALLPALRHQGWGHTLMTAMEAWARAHGARKLSLTYLSHNTAAQRLYTRLGYHEEARIPAQYWIAGQPCDAVWAAKWMSTPVP